MDYYWFNSSVKSLSEMVVLFPSVYLGFHRKVREISLLSIHCDS